MLYRLSNYRDMFKQWTNELKVMTDRISNMRQQLYNALRDKGRPSVGFYRPKTLLLDVVCLAGRYSR